MNKEELPNRLPKMPQGISGWCGSDPLNGLCNDRTGYLETETDFLSIFTVSTLIYCYRSVFDKSSSAGNM